MLSPRGRFSDESRPCRDRDVDRSWDKSWPRRGSFERQVVAPPQPRRGGSAETAARRRYLEARHLETPLDPSAYAFRASGSDAASETCPPVVQPEAARRVIQLPGKHILALPIFCEDTVTGDVHSREACDFALHAVDAINNKDDGFFDELLPNVILVPHVYVMPCSQGAGAEQFRRAVAAHPTAAAMIGPGCSNDVADMASLRDEVGRQVLISPESTAPLLGDDALYPNVARLSSPDSLGFAALDALVEHYSAVVPGGWRHVAILYDDSLWGSSHARGFVEALDGQAEVLGGGTCVGGGCAEVVEDPTTGDPLGIGLSLSRWYALANKTSAETLLIEEAERLLDAVEKTHANIVFVAANQLVMAYFFKAVYHAKDPAGHAWLVAWPIVAGDVDTASGMLGALGFGETVVDYDTAPERSTTRRYVDLWSRASSRGACDADSRDRDPDRDPGAKWCDVDGDPTTTKSPYGHFWVDAVLAYALATDTLDRTRREDPDALYEAILALQPFEGVTGTVRLDKRTGDRDGTLALKNAQIIEAKEKDERRLSVSLDAMFVTKGAYADDELFVDDGVRFPGDTHSCPEDECCPSSAVREPKRGRVDAATWGPTLQACGLVGYPAAMVRGPGPTLQACGLVTTQVERRRVQHEHRRGNPEVLSRPAQRVPRHGRRLRDSRHRRVALPEVATRGARAPRRQTPAQGAAQRHAAPVRRGVGRVRRRLRRRAGDDRRGRARRRDAPPREAAQTAAAPRVSSFGRVRPAAAARRCGRVVVVVALVRVRGALDDAVRAHGRRRAGLAADEDAVAVAFVVDGVGRPRRRRRGPRRVEPPRPFHPRRRPATHLRALRRVRARSAQERQPRGREGANGDAAASTSSRPPPRNRPASHGISTSRGRGGDATRLPRIIHVVAAARPASTESPRAGLRRRRATRAGLRARHRDVLVAGRVPPRVGDHGVRRESRDGQGVVLRRRPARDSGVGASFRAAFPVSPPPSRRRDATAQVVTSRDDLSSLPGAPALWSEVAYDAARSSKRRGCFDRPRAASVEELGPQVLCSYDVVHRRRQDQGLAGALRARRGVRRVSIAVAGERARGAAEDGPRATGRPDDPMRRERRAAVDVVLRARRRHGGRRARRGTQRDARQRVAVVRSVRRRDARAPSGIEAFETTPRGAAWAVVQARDVEARPRGIGRHALAR